MPKNVIKGRTWEKERRDRLNKTFDDLAKLLPEFQPNVAFTKIEILQKTIVFVDELQKQIHEVLHGKCPSILKSVEELEESLKALILRNNELLNLLQKAGIEVPPFSGPKLLRCIVTIHKKTVPAANHENNPNKINETNGFQADVVGKEAKIQKGCKKSKSKENRKNASKKSKKPEGIQKIVFNKTFGQRNIKSNNKRKNGTNKASLPFFASENSSLETVSIVEQCAVPKNNVVLEEDSNSIAILPLFTQPSAILGGDACVTANNNESNGPDINVQPAPQLIAESSPQKTVVTNTSVTTGSEIVAIVSPDALKIPESSLKTSGGSEFKTPKVAAKLTKPPPKDKNAAKVRKRKPNDSQQKSGQLTLNHQQTSQKQAKLEHAALIVSPENQISCEARNKIKILSDIVVTPTEVLGQNETLAASIISSEEIPPSTPELPNFLENLEITPNDSHGSLSPTAAFLLSFPVVSSSTGRQSESDQIHQLSPSEAGILDLDEKHTIGTSQFLENISSLLTTSLAKPNIKQETQIGEFTNENATTKIKEEPKPNDASEICNGLSSSTIVKPSQNAMESNLLDFSTPTIQADSNKPKESFDYAEFLDNLKSSPAKPTAKCNNVKSHTIPNFSFSTHGATAPAILSNPPLSKAPVSNNNNFYESLSSIKPTAVTSAAPTINNISTSYSISSLVSAPNYSNSFSYSSATNIFTTPTTMESSLSSPMAPSIVSSSFKTSQTNSIHSRPTDCKNLKASPFAFAPTFIPFSSQNTYTPYNYDATSLSQTNATSKPPHHITAVSSASVSISNNCTPFPKCSLNTASSVRSLALNPILPTASSSTFKESNVSSSLNTGYNNSAHQTNQFNKPLAVNQKFSQSKPLAPSLNSCSALQNANVHKKPVNWMTTSCSEKKPPEPSYSLNLTPVTKTYMQNSTYSNPSYSQSQTPLSFYDDNNVPWSPNRFLESHNFLSAPVLPTLHGDLALHTINSDINYNASNNNQHSNVRSISSKTQLFTPKKYGPEPNAKPITAEPPFKDRARDLHKNTQSSVQNTIPTSLSNTMPTSSNQANFFSVSQLVSDPKDKKSKASANRKLSYSHKHPLANIDKNANQPKTDGGQRYSHQTQMQQTSHLPTAAHLPVQSQSQPLTSFNESFSIPMLTAEPVKPQLLNNYSAEALISGPAHHTNVDKKKSTFVSSNSLSMEFYNPADSLMDFSTSNDIFNPYLAHNNLSTLDTNNYSSMLPTYTDTTITNTQDAQLNFDAAQIPSQPQNHSIHNITQNYSQMASASTSITSSNYYQPPQFLVVPPIPKEKDRDTKKTNSSNYSIANLSFDSTQSNIFTTPIALSSPLVTMPPAPNLMFSQSKSAINPGNASGNSYALPSNVYKNTSYQPNFISNTNSNYQYPLENYGSFNDGQKPTYGSSNTNHDTRNNLHGNNQSANSGHISNSGNALTNFNLSTICPEINEKNSNWS